MHVSIIFSFRRQKKEREKDAPPFTWRESNSQLTIVLNVKGVRQRDAKFVFEKMSLCASGVVPTSNQTFSLFLSLAWELDASRCSACISAKNVVLTLSKLTPCIWGRLEADEEPSAEFSCRSPSASPAPSPAVSLSNLTMASMWMC
jgi:hypothetical protein